MIRSFVLAVGVGLSLIGGLPQAPAAEPPGMFPPTYSNNPTVASVEGKSIRLDDLKTASIQQLMIQLYQMQKMLLKQKALEMLQENHPEMRLEDIHPVSRQEVETFYNNEPGIRKIGDLEQMEGEIRAFLEKRRQQDYLDNIEHKYALAVESGWVVDYLNAPNDFKVRAELGTAMLLFGPQEPNRAQRQVLLMEYSDFLCPFCQKVQRTLAALRRKYKEEVEFGYRHFPLHAEARAMAEAVECAREQGRFWEYQTRLYNDPIAHKEPARLLSTAREVGVHSTDDFRACLESGKFRERVENDMEDGFRLGVQGTPTFIIGLYDADNRVVEGEILSGAVGGDKFSRVIEKYLAFSRASAKKTECPDC